MKLLVLLMLFILVSCSKSDVTPAVQLFTNTDVETGAGIPSGWWVNTSVSNAEYTWSDQAAYSGTRSLKIESLLSQSLIPSWGQSVTTDIPAGKNLTLQVRIKGNLTGKGAAVAISCLNTTVGLQAQQFSTTEGSTSIKENIDWASYTVKLDNVKGDINEIRVYLMILPNTTGEVYFDDITLTAN